MLSPLFFFLSVRRAARNVIPGNAHLCVKVGMQPKHVQRKGEKSVLTSSSLFVALASATMDPNTAYILIGVVVVVFLFLLMASSSGTAAKRVVKKYYCPHCNRQINFTAPPGRPVQNQSLSASARGRGNTPHLQPRPVSPRINAPVQRRGGKIYCPYCRKEILGN